MGDKIDKLPIDDTALTTNSDIEMIGALFQNKEQVSKISSEFKDPVIGGTLFIIISSHPFDRIVRSTGCNNELYILLIKLLCFIVLFYILKNRL